MGFKRLAQGWNVIEEHKSKVEWEVLSEKKTNRLSIYLPQLAFTNLIQWKLIRRNRDEKVSRQGGALTSFSVSGR